MNSISKNLRIFFVQSLPSGSGSLPSDSAPDIAKNTGTENLQKIATISEIKKFALAGLNVENSEKPRLPVWLNITKNIARPLKNSR